MHTDMHFIVHTESHTVFIFIYIISPSAFVSISVCTICQIISISTLQVLLGHQVVVYALLQPLETYRGKTKRNQEALRNHLK